jgi:UDP-3-O-[3-hydroxymyristoyl] glucosamine N-acyltransferase
MVCPAPLAVVSRIAPTAQLVNSESISIGDGAVIEHFAVVGLPNRSSNVFRCEQERRVVIARNVLVGCYTILFEGARLDDGAQVEDRCLIGSRTVIGANSRVLGGAQVHDHVRVGERTYIGGFVADHCRIGNECYVFGSLIHRLHKPHANPWDVTDEVGPILEDRVIVGWGAVIIGPVTIGAGARIRPGAVVRESITPALVHG